MQKDVWYNGKWNNLSGSLAEFKVAYKNLTGNTFTLNKGEGTFGGYYEGSSFNHLPQGYLGDPTGSKWDE